MPTRASELRWAQSKRWLRSTRRSTFACCAPEPSCLKSKATPDYDDIDIDDFNHYNVEDADDTDDVDRDDDEDHDDVGDGDNADAPVPQSA